MLICSFIWTREGIGSLSLTCKRLNANCGPGPWILTKYCLRLRTYERLKCHLVLASTMTLDIGNLDVVTARLLHSRKKKGPILVGVDYQRSSGHEYEYFYPILYATYRVSGFLQSNNQNTHCFLFETLARVSSGDMRAKENNNIPANPWLQLPSKLGLAEFRCCDHEWY